MDDNKVNKTFRRKINKITNFCGVLKYDTGKITFYIAENNAELTDDGCAIINVLWKSINGLQRKIGKHSIMKAVIIISCVMS